LTSGRFGNGNILLHIPLFPAFYGYEVNRSASVGCRRFYYSRKGYSEEDPRVSQPSLTNFVVDDESVIASTLAAILQMNGFSAKFFTCPVEAFIPTSESRTMKRV
jgi:hypothetical protein